ncbi:MAG: hypothetical protein RR415_07120 [Ruthenibacterium sp.]
MLFDAGTWWLFGILLTILLGVVGALLSRSIFKKIDENSADIKEVRENYTPRNEHSEKSKELRTELKADIKEVRTELRGELQKLSSDIEDIKENCLRKDDFLNSVGALQNEIRQITKFLISNGGKGNG